MSPHPDEIITQLTAKYPLTPEQQSQLRAVLTNEEVKTAVEAGSFIPESFLIPVLATTIFYVPTPSTAIFILYHPEMLEQLRKHIANTPANMMRYLELREQINQAATIKTRVEKTLLLRKISAQLQALADFIIASPVLRHEVPHLPRVLALHLNTELIWLQKTAISYFQQLFSPAKKIHNIEFLPKHDGVQLGNRMLISYHNEHEIEQRIIFYIKTHQHGSLRAGGSTTATVDPKELFFYKALEHSRFGPKAHFFFNPLSPSSFYIATQDESFTKIPGKIKFFETYSQAERSEQALHPVRGNTAAETGVVRAEVLLRIFNLWDITTNSGNFGRTLVPEESEKWRIIDFRVNTQDVYEPGLMFEDFRDGIGMAGLDPSGTFLTAVLSNSTPHERIQLAVPLIEEFEQGKCHHHDATRHLPLSAAIDRAHSEIAAYITENHEALMIDQEKTQADLARYIAMVKENLKQFVDGLKHSITEMPQSPSA